MNKPPRVLTLNEVAARLNMKKSNVAKFLARRGIEPAFTKTQGYLWDEEVIERVRREREADTEKMASDAKRRQAALRRAGRNGQATEHRNLGRRERQVLVSLLQHPRLRTEAEHAAARRLALRGLTARIPNEPGAWQLTEAGRPLAVELAE